MAAMKRHARDDLVCGGTLAAALRIVMSPAACASVLVAHSLAAAAACNGIKSSLAAFPLVVPMTRALSFNVSPPPIYPQVDHP